MSTTALLEVKGLCRYFGARVALEDIRFNLAPSELKLLVGANGAGKSTLLFLLAGLLAPSKGEILFNGAPFAARRGRERSKIGYAGDRPFLYGDLSIHESLALLSRAAPSPPETAKRAKELLEELGLAGVQERRLRECSQGTIRKAGIARAFLFQPELVLLDEPFAHLDAASARSLLGLIKREQQSGCAFIIAAHEAELRSSLGGAEIELVAGRQKGESFVNRGNA